MTASVAAALGVGDVNGEGHDAHQGAPGGGGEQQRARRDGEDVFPLPPHGAGGGGKGGDGGRQRSGEGEEHVEGRVRVLLLLGRVRRREVEERRDEVGARPVFSSSVGIRGRRPLEPTTETDGDHQSQNPVEGLRRSPFITSCGRAWRGRVAPPHERLLVVHDL